MRQTCALSNATRFAVLVRDQHDEPLSELVEREKNNLARSVPFGIGTLLSLSGCCIPDLKKAEPGREPHQFLAWSLPATLPRDSSRFIDLNLPALSVRVPAQLLQNRPDIREAERELACRRVARARFFPSLSLRADVGYEAFNTSYLFNTPGCLTASVIATDRTCHSPFDRDHRK